MREGDADPMTQDFPPDARFDRLKALSDRELRRLANGSPTIYDRDLIEAARMEITVRGVGTATDTEQTQPMDAVAAEAANAVRAMAQVRYEVFRGRLATWDELFSRAAAFATQVGPERLISISHSEDRNDGVVTVWYWA